MKQVILVLVLAALLSSCSTNRACVHISETQAPNFKKLGFVLSVEQDQALCEAGQTQLQKEKGECGDSYDVLADREKTLKADASRLRKQLKSISCKQ